MARRRGRARRNKQRNGWGPTRFAMDTVGELRRAHWPSRPETIRLTGIVIGVMAVLAAFIGFFDYGVSKLSDAIFG